MAKPSSGTVNPHSRTGVRIVVAGDQGTGKSSLIITAAADNFPVNVPPVLPPTRLPEDLYPDRVPITIIDTSSRAEDSDKVAEELQRADTVVLTYACDRPETLENLSIFWLPHLRKLEVKVPVIVVGCRLDLRDENQQVSLEQVMSPIMQQFREIETCIECSACRHIQVPEVFYYAQKAVLHPTAPLFDQESQTLKPRCVRALKRIFILCDHDRDGALSDAELNDFQVKCFNAPLQPSEIVGVKKVVQEKMSEGVNERGLTLTGFLFLHALFIEKGRLETTWTVLRKFGYNDDIKLADDLIPPVKRAPDQSVELTNDALDFLKAIFDAFDGDRDGMLRPRPDLVSAAKTSETICQNCMAILKLLSEEVFDFSRGEMTQQKIKELKQSLNSEFQLIHELCLYVLSVSQRTELIRATLSTLHAFLSWIPLGYIFESPLLETLLNFFPVPAYQNLTLQCLTEVAVLQFRNYYDAHIKMYNIFMVQLQSILPPTTNIPEAYAHGSSEEQAFIQNVAMFFTSFFKVHIRILESTKENITALLLGLEYLINISYVDDTEVFKVCLDYWNVLVAELFEPHRLENPAAAAASMMGLQVPGMVDGIGSQLLQRRQLYAGPMSKLRMLMISRMAKPEEVLIVEDENGNLVRETMKDNAVLVQYKIMRETLIYLSHLDHDDTEKQMLRKLSKQLSGEDWTWNNLNTLCWAIGSISGSMLEEQENRFLVMVIRDLLNLCEITKGKENKAVIASNIMYVVGQYPRFLRAHWKFLKTVVNKLFEFMHETHPGVQDMACDTFLKIVQKCKRKFVITQVGENGSFVSELLTTLPNTIADLEPHQIHSFYESVGYMIQAESDVQKRDEYLQKLMVLPNQRWMEIIGKAHQNVDFLKDQDVIRNVLNILQTNTSVASSLGTYFLPQITLIFLDVLNVYRMYSELISKSITEGGPFASRTSYVKLLRSVKRETLKLVDTFLDKAEDQPQIAKHFVPPMMDPVLGDYARNVPDARESEVLSLFATIVNKYKAAMVEDVPRIFEAVFQCTLEMITKNFEDYPEHRLNFFSLLRAIATHCFPALICLSSQQLKLVMDSIIWAFRHTERNIAETGLNLLFEMLKKFQVSEFCNQFYRTYFLTFEQEIFAVLTDTFHKPGFKLHVLVLQHLFCLADSGSLTEPLWDAATNPYPYPSNAAFVREFTIKLLSTSFPNMTASEVTQFVNGLFESTNDLAIFKTHIRDFLVQSKEFSAQDNKDLYAEEAAAQRQRERQRMLSIPGLVAPSELQDEMVDS